MSVGISTRPSSSPIKKIVSTALAVAAIATLACAPSTYQSTSASTPVGTIVASAPSPDPRIGLSTGEFNAGEAVWNLNVLSQTKPSEKFVGGVNSDLAFTGNYVIQGSFNGYQVWDISNPRQPTLRTAYVCPASQSDVSVYRNLLFVSG